MKIIALNGKIGSGKDTVGRIIQCFINHDKNSLVELERLLKEESTVEVLHYLHQVVPKIETSFQQSSSDFKVKRFAHKLKLIASILTGIPIERFESQEFKNTYLSSEWNWEGTNGIVEYQVRRFLQNLGTEAIREQIHENAWVNALMCELQPTNNYIITDMRFKNEFAAVIEHHGLVWRINCTDYQPKENEHISETELDDANFHYVIYADRGNMKQLVEEVRKGLVHFKII